MRGFLRGPTLALATVLTLLAPIVAKAEGATSWGATLRLEATAERDGLVRTEIELEPELEVGLGRGWRLVLSGRLRGDLERASAIISAKPRRRRGWTSPSTRRGVSSVP